MGRGEHTYYVDDADLNYDVHWRACVGGGWGKPFLWFRCISLKENAISH